MVSISTVPVSTVMACRAADPFTAIYEKFTVIPYDSDMGIEIDEIKIYKVDCK